MRKCGRGTASWLDSSPFEGMEWGGGGGGGRQKESMSSVHASNGGRGGQQVG